MYLGMFVIPPSLSLSLPLFLPSLYASLPLPISPSLPPSVFVCQYEKKREKIEEKILKITDGMSKSITIHGDFVRAKRQGLMKL